MEFITRRSMFRQIGVIGAAAMLGGCVVEERGRPYAAPAPTAEIYVQSAPPPVRYEQRPPPPRPIEEVHWREGHWVWDGRQYAWNPGEWIVRPRREAVWEPAHWVERPGRGWVLIPGHWRS